MFEAPGLPQFELPRELRAIYGGSLGFSAPRVYANFVESLDGITAIPGLTESNRLIAGGNEQDRFVMGLLRACADAVLIGAGTLHGSPHTHWTPQHAYPAAADRYGDLRRRRGSSAQPLLVVVSGSGRIDPQHPGFAERALVLTTEEHEEDLRRRLPRTATVKAIGERPPLNLSAIIDILRAAGNELILCEGGPRLFGELLKARAVDEIFLTISPRLAGQPADQQRLSLVEGVPLLPESVVGCKVLTVRKAGSHLFLRYELDRVQHPEP